MNRMTILTIFLFAFGLYAEKLNHNVIACPDRDHFKAFITYVQEENGMEEVFRLKEEKKCFLFETGTKYMPIVNNGVFRIVKINGVIYWALFNE